MTGTKQFSDRGRGIAARITGAPLLWAAGLALFSLPLVTGCDDNVSIRNPFADPPAQTAQQPEPPKPAPQAQDNQREGQARRSMIRTTSIRSGSGLGGGSDVENRMSLDEVVDRLKAEIDSSVDFAPTQVVWMIDATQSASDLRRDVSQSIQRIYGDFKNKGFSTGGKSADALKTAIVAFGEQPQYVLEDPTEDFEQVIEHLKSLPTDDSGKENTFAAIQQAIEKYADSSRETLIIVATDEAGDDANRVDETIEKAKTAGVRVHVIGIPAPFGHKRVDGNTPESRQDGMPVLVQGPETRYPQMLNMRFAGGGYGTEYIDSGYGPFGLNYLARASGGSYLIARNIRSGGWPGNAPRFADKVMQKYPPQYVSEQEYQQMLASNKAAAALHRVGQQAEIEAMTYPATIFTVRDEAQLKNALDNAQRIAARLGPLVDRVYEPLSDGEKDRENLTDPRLQAAYDLALGRAAAAKARVDGYNQMLAILKGGRKFEDPDKDTWYLEPANTLAEAGSRLERIRIQADEALNRVIKDHPGTPWAKLAEKELETPIGWEWVEN